MTFVFMHTFAQGVLCIIYPIENIKKIIQRTFAHRVLLHKMDKLLKLQGNTFAHYAPSKEGIRTVQKVMHPFYNPLEGGALMHISWSENEHRLMAIFF